MKTAEDIRNLQKENKASRLEDTILKEIEEIAKSSKETSLFKYIYDIDDYLDSEEIQMLKDAGFEVEVEEREGNWRTDECRCQKLYIQW